MRQFLLSLCLSVSVVFGQEHLVDTSFSFGETNITDIRDIALFPDGSIAYGGVGRYASIGIAATNGALTIRNAGGVLTEAESVAVDPEDRAVYGGGTPSALNSPVWRVTTFDDASWSYRENLQGSARKVLRLRDRDLLVAGTVFANIGLAKLDLSGTLDSDFQHTNFAGIEVTSVAETADGRILAAYQVPVEGVMTFGFGRWDRNGLRDQNYDGNWATNWGTNAHVTVLKKAPSTNAFVAALQTEPLGTGGPKVTQVVLLDENGVPQGLLLESPFIQGTVNAIAFEVVTPATALNSGYDRILVGGDFIGVEETQCNRLAAISKDGTVAWCIPGNAGPDGPIHAADVQLDGKVLIGGTFTNVGGIESKGMARLAGNSGSGQTYLYWADAEFRGFEAERHSSLTLVRSGNTNNPLSVSIVVSTNGVTREKPEIPSTVQFAPGQTVALVSADIDNNTVRENRLRYLVSAFVTNSNVLVTRPTAELVVLDDETPGTVDPSLNFSLHRGFYSMGLQSDGKMIVGGSGTVLMRLNPDGSVDPTFVTNGIPALAGSWAIYRIEPQDDGKVYVSGRFNTSAGTYGINHVARLNVNGTLDTTFDPRLGKAAASISDQALMRVMEDGDVLVWVGGFVRHEGVMEGIARLDSTGARRTVFAGSLPWRDIAQMEYLPTGEVFAYGGGPGPTGNLYKYRSNGSRDTNFVLAVPSSNNGYVYEMALVANSLLLGGSFKQVNSLASPYLARVDLENGAVDTNLSVKVNADVESIREYNGQIYLSGDFTTVNGVDRFRLARLDLDGSVDMTFDPGLGSNHGPGLLEFQADGKLVIGSSASRVDGIPTPTLVRLEGDASPGEIRLVSRRIVVSETNGVARIELERVGGSRGALSATIETFEGSALEGTNFVGTNFVVHFADGEFGRRVVEIPIHAVAGPNGARTFAVVVASAGASEEATVLIEDVDAEFFGGSVSVGTNQVNDLAVGPNGAIYLAGRFARINEVAVTNLARLNPDLSVDATFELERLRFPSPPTFLRVVVRTNGSVVFGGSFSQIGTNFWRSLAQVNQQGIYDRDFMRNYVAWGQISPSVTHITLQEDDKLLVSNGSALTRINPDGSRDTNFVFSEIGKMIEHPDGNIYAVKSTRTLIRVSPITGASQQIAAVEHKIGLTAVGFPVIYALAVDRHGALLLGGNFTHVNGTLAPRLVRISTNGVIDSTFVPEVGVTGLNPQDQVTAIQVLPGGEILIGGKFGEVQGSPQRTLALISEDGALRRSFDPIVQGDGIHEFELVPDGGVLVRGSITNLDGRDVGGVFKLALPPSMPPVAQILWPTNGTEIRVSDAIEPFVIRVRAFDPDGFLEKVVVDLDGVALSTNSAGNFVVQQQGPPSFGEHRLTVTATDQTGFIASETVTFQVINVAQGPIMLRRVGGEWVVEYIGVRLQVSEDLRTWSDAHVGGGQFRLNATAPRQFFRAAYQ